MKLNFWGCKMENSERVKEVFSQALESLWQGKEQGKTEIEQMINKYNDLSFASWKLAQEWTKFLKELQNFITEDMKK